MNRKLTTVVVLYCKHGRNKTIVISDVCDVFVERFQNFEPPSRPVIHNSIQDLNKPAQ